MPWAEPKPRVEEKIVRAENYFPGSSWIDTLGPIRWTCRLRIFFPGRSKDDYARGSGFLVRLTPASKKDLVMTAGHNLVDSDGKYAESIEVFFAGGINIGEVGSETVTVRKDSGEYFASRSYEKDPTEKNAINDYGYILLEKHPDPKPPRGGFSFSAIIDEKSMLEREATVYGYPAQLDGKVVRSDWAVNAMGKIMRIELDGRQLRYGVSTEKGHSGGPVCVKTGDHYTAIGIHNYSGETEKMGNCGSIFTCRNLFEMFERCYERTSIELYVPKPAKGLNSGPIYLKVPPGRGSRVIAQRGMDRYTELDLIPVETYPVPTADSNQVAQPPKYIIAAAHRVPFIILEFCPIPKRREGELTKRGGMAINSIEEDLVYGRPTERNLIELKPTTAPRGGARPRGKLWTISTVGPRINTLRIPQTSLDTKPENLGCDCNEVVEIPIVELVDGLAGGKDKEHNKFTIDGLF